MMLMDTQKGMANSDWHAADVKAALEKKGLTLIGLAKKHGYSHFQRVLTTHWWAAEQIVAKALEKDPAEIWPSRYEGSRDRAQARTRKIKVTKGGRIRVESAE
jgi:Ner family transcriptional regulator